jgi:hypothetical protein
MTTGQPEVPSGLFIPEETSTGMEIHFTSNGKKEQRLNPSTVKTQLKTTQQLLTMPLQPPKKAPKKDVVSVPVVVALHTLLHSPLKKFT